MLEFDTILVILDKPKHDQLALERATALAGGAGAHLHLASFCWLPMATRTDVFDTHQRRAIKKSAMAERRRWLDGLLRDRALAAADVSTEVVWTEDIAGWVADWCPQHRGAMVVKTVHPSRSLLHTPLDWALLRSCPAPLLLASTAARAGSGNVLATVDLHRRDAAHRRLNRRVLEAAARFAALGGGRLHCVNVVEVDASFEDLEYFDAPKMRKQATDAARERLVELTRDLDVAQRCMHLPSGKVGHAIATVAEAIDADLVVVGTGARRGVGARLLGSSAEKIFSRLQAQVSCDVLAVHA